MDPESKGSITALEFLVQRLFVPTEAFSLKGNYVCNKISTGFVTPEKQKPIKTMPRSASASKVFRGSGIVGISIIEIFLLSEQGLKSREVKTIKAMKRQSSPKRRGHFYL